MVDTSDRRTARRRWFVFGMVQLVAAILIAGAFAFRGFIDLGSPDGRLSLCILHDMAHVYCPLCGGTRAMVSLCRGQVLLSLRQNPLSFLLAVGFLFFDVRAAIRIARNHPTPVEIPKWYLFTLLAVGVGFFFVRNYYLLYRGIDFLGDFIH